MLILDDATSSVDPTKEHEIRDALTEVMRGRTTIVIAHRPATIALADRVVLLDAGRVVAEGTHAELLATSDALPPGARRGRGRIDAAPTDRRLPEEVAVRCGVRPASPRRTHSIASRPEWVMRRAAADAAPLPPRGHRQLAS